MRVGVGALGLIVLLAGGVFAGQGLGYIPGSFMSGDITWFWIGGGMVIAGAALIGVVILRSPDRV